MKHSSIGYLTFALTVAVAGSGQAETIKLYSDTNSHGATSVAESKYRTAPLAAAAGHGTGWSYSGSAGPASWGRHENAAGALAVVGARMKAGLENHALREIWDHMPLLESPEMTKSAS